MVADGYEFAKNKQNLAAIGKSRAIYSIQIIGELLHVPLAQIQEVLF